MTYLIRNKEFRVRHENVGVYSTTGGNRFGRYWFDDTAARLGGTDGSYHSANADSVNLKGTQTILQDDIGIIRSTSSGVDSGLPAGEYELIYKAQVRLDGGAGGASAANADPQSFQISRYQITPPTSTFTPILRPIGSGLSHYEDNVNGIYTQVGVNIQWSDWTGGNGLMYYRMYDLYWRFSTTGAANGSRSNLRIYNHSDHVHVYNWEDIRIIKLS